MELVGSPRTEQGLQAVPVAQLADRVRAATDGKGSKALRGCGALQIDAKQGDIQSEFTSFRYDVTFWKAGGAADQAKHMAPPAASTPPRRCSPGSASRRPRPPPRPRPPTLPARPRAPPRACSA